MGYTSTFFKNETRKGVTRFTSGVTTCDACAQNYAVTLDEKSDKLVCSPCAQGYVRDSRDVVASGETKCTKCAEGYHVQQRGSESVCVQCDIGRVPSLFEVHDVQANSETWCLPKICELDEYVSAGECKRCKTGYIRAGFSVDTDVLGDDATKGDTACTLCTENYRVVGNVESGFTCEPCGGHGTSEPGANVTESLQTECDFDLCPVNTRAFNRTCVPCAKGYENKAGDDPLAGDLPPRVAQKTIGPTVSRSACRAPRGRLARLATIDSVRFSTARRFPRKALLRVSVAFVRVDLVTRRSYQKQRA